MEKNEMFDELTAHRRALCDQLAGIGAAEWDIDSLCEGWRIRDTLAHLVTLQEVPQRKFIVGVFGMQGFHRRVDRFAREFGNREPEELLALYRHAAPRRQAPPVVGPIAPLTDVVVHSLDMQRPLGLPAIHTEAVARTVLDALSGGLVGFSSKRLGRGLRFEATDLSWSAGNGTPVRGSCADLLLSIMGRRSAIAALDGDGAAVLAARIHS